MERIEKLFPRYDQNGKELIYRAFRIAEEALKDQTRSNGAPFLEHPTAVAQIACDEIGLSAECIAAVYLHEAELSMPESWTDGPLYYTDTYGEGDILSLCGLSIHVLHTPGHTPGSVCLAVEDTLFSGDTLFMDSCGRTDLPCGNQATLMQSLKRLAALPTDYRVLSGHGQSTTLLEEKKYNPFLNR